MRRKKSKIDHALTLKKAEKSKKIGHHKTPTLTTELHEHVECSRRGSNSRLCGPASLVRITIRLVVTPDGTPQKRTQGLALDRTLNVRTELRTRFYGIKRLSLAKFKVIISSFYRGQPCDNRQHTHRWCQKRGRPSCCVDVFTHNLHVLLLASY